jgi:transcriptional antiterminator RfaH
LKTWYAIYVKSKAEKKVAKELFLLGIDHYLPLRKVLRQWSDRKKWIEEPLFKSYVFVHIEQKDYYTVLQTFGVVKYITFESKAVPIPTQQIDAIRYYLNEKDPQITIPENWSKGQTVEVISGSMTGLTGKLVEFKGKHWLGVEIEAIGHSIVIQIQKNKLRPI